jgi:hypothetical protein
MRRRGQRPSRRSRQVAASASTARVVRGRTSTKSSHPEGRAKGSGERPSPVGRVGTKRFPRASQRGASPASDTGRARIANGMRNGSPDWCPPRCIPRSRGAASQNRELGPAPSEAREDPAASNPSPSLRSLSSAGSLRSHSLAPRSAPRWLEPHGGDPRYTRWTANRCPDGSVRCRE